MIPSGVPRPARAGAGGELVRVRVSAVRVQEVAKIEARIRACRKAKDLAIRLRSAAPLVVIESPLVSSSRFSFLARRHGAERERLALLDNDWAVHSPARSAGCERNVALRRTRSSAPDIPNPRSVVWTAPLYPPSPLEAPRIGPRRLVDLVACRTLDAFRPCRRRSAVSGRAEVRSREGDTVPVVAAVRPTFSRASRGSARPGPAPASGCNVIG